MKNKILFILVNFISIACFSQRENGFSYQSILRDNNGTPVANQDLYMEIEITQGTNGIVVYEESHNATTNFVGIINLIIGSGTSNDDISDILWNNPPYFMEVYVNDGSGLQLISSSEILNVPTAMYAKYGKDEDSDTTNEYNTDLLLNGNNLEIVDAGGTLTVDLSSLQSLSGTDDQNIVGSGLSGDTLTIGIEGGSSQTIDLSTIKGTDDQNIFNSGLVGSALTIGIEGGNSQIVDLSSLIGSDDQNASEVISSQTNNIQALNVDAAIAELAIEKFDVQGGIMYGGINMNNNNINFIGTAIADTFSGELKGSINIATTAITQLPNNFSNRIATTQYVDLSTAAGGTDDQNIVGSVLSGNILTIGIEGGSSQAVDLSSIQGTDNQNIFNSGLAGNALTIGIEGGNSQTVDLSSLIGSDNQTASLVGSNAAGNLAATNVQTALEELDLETTSNTTTGTTNATAIAFINNLADGKIYLGDAIGDAQEVSLTGDVTIDNTGTTTIANDAVGNAKLDKTNIPLSGFLAATADVALGTNKLTGVLDPTAAQDAATKNYVDVTNSTNANLNGDVTSSGNITTIGTGKVVSAMILDGTIVVGDLANDAVETTKIKNANVTNAKLDKTNIPLSGFAAATADVALGTNKLTGVLDPTAAQDAATKNYVDVTNSTNANLTGDVTSSGNTTTIGNDKVLNAMILDANVTEAKLAIDAVTTTKIQNASVTEPKLAITGGLPTIGDVLTWNAAGMVWGSSGGAGADKVSVDGASTAGYIGTTGAVGVIRTDPSTMSYILGGDFITMGVANNGITTTQIDDGTIATADVADLNITEAKLALNAVTTTKILDANVTEAKLAIDAVTTTKIQNASVTEPKLAITGGLPTIGDVLTWNAAGMVWGSSGGAGAVPTGSDKQTLRNNVGTWVIDEVLQNDGINIRTQTDIYVSGSAANPSIGGITIGKGNSSMSANTALGLNALFTNSTGNHNTAVGSNALQINSTGLNNTAVGSLALQANQGGTENTAVGSNALTDNLSGDNNTALGYNSLEDNIASNNTAVGSNTLKTNLGGTENTAVGSNALFTNLTGNNNTAVGYNSLNINDAGDDNTAVGSNTLQANQGGTKNTALGSQALSANLNGFNNTAIGYNAGSSISSGKHNVIIGHGANTSSGVGENEIVIGKGATGIGNNIAVIGNAALEKVYAAQDGEAIIYNGGLVIKSTSAASDMVLPPPAVNTAGFFTSNAYKINHDLTLDGAFNVGDELNITVTNDKVKTTSVVMASPDEDFTIDIHTVRNGSFQVRIKNISIAFPDDDIVRINYIVL